MRITGICNVSKLIFSSYILRIFLFLSFINCCNFSRAQCPTPTNLKTTELSYERISTVPQIFRFHYRVTVPCDEGEPFENPIYAFDPQHQQTISENLIFDSVKKSTKVINACIFLPTPPCFQDFYFHADFGIGDYSQIGYYVFVPDCCLAYQFKNLSYDLNLSKEEDLPIEETKGDCNPSFGQVYNSILTFIKTPVLHADLKNTSPFFSQEDTILNVCIDSNFNYQIKANDADRDSVAYHFAAAKNYIGTIYGPVPTFQIITKVPFPNVFYNQPAGYDEKHPLGPSVNINEKSGLVTGSLPDTGTYLMTVYALEYRNHLLLDSVSKNFIVRAFNCSDYPKPKAVTNAEYKSCLDFTITPANYSKPIYERYNFSNTNFLWNFGDGDTSTSFYPVHTYADTGTYKISLVIFPGLYCADTAYSKAVIYPKLNAAFSYSDSCAFQNIYFKNNSVSTSGKINYTLWTFNLPGEPADSLHINNPIYNFHDYNKSYRVTLSVGNNKGCFAIDSQFVNIYKPPLPLAFHDTILSTGATLQFFADDGYNGNNASFLWKPSFGLDDPFIADPVLNSNTDNTYYVSIKNAYNCIRTDSVKIKYYKGPDIYIPNAFTPNGDGLNDIFMPTPVGIAKFYFFRIFNRWGQIIFQTSQSFKGWNGMIGNQPAFPGTYIWEISGEDLKNSDIDKKGTVLLIR